MHSTILIQRLTFYLTLVAIVSGSGAAYAWSVGEPFYTTDGLTMYYAARSLGLEQRVDVPAIEIAQVVLGRDGQYFSKYDPAVPTLAAHVVGYADGFAERAIANRFAVGAIAVMVVPVSAMALAMGAFFLLVLQHKVHLRSAILLTLVVAFSTSVWPYARLFFAEAITTFCLVAGAAWLHVRHPHTAGQVLGVSLLLGISIMSRSHTIIFVVAFLGFMLSYKPQSLRWWQPFLLLVGPGIAISVLGIHNWLRFGHLWATGYSQEGFTTFPLAGLVGNLVSPGKSIFVYAPPLVISTLLWPRFRRYFPASAWLLVWLTLPPLLFYSTWWAWHGGWAWGPRFLVPLMPLWCLPWVVLPRRVTWTTAAVLSVALGFCVQVTGTFTDMNKVYLDALDSIQVQDDERIYAMVHYDFMHSPVYAGLRQLQDGQREPQAIYELQSTDLTADWVYGVPQAVERVALLSGAWLLWCLWWNPTTLSLMTRGQEQKNG